MAAKGFEREYLSFLLALLRDIWWFGRTGDSSGLVNRDLTEVIEGGEQVPQGWVEASIARVQQTMRTLRYNVNAVFTMECLMIDVMRPV